MKTHHILITFYFLISCTNIEKGESLEVTKLKSKETKELEPNISCDKEISIDQLKDFLNLIESKCSNGSNTNHKDFLSSNLISDYGKDFCSLIISSLKEKEGNIEYDVYEDNGICVGYISINSVNIYDDGEEKIRNEYATFLYIVRDKSKKLKIKEIGGAG